MGARAAWVAGVFVGCLQLAAAQAERLEASVGLAPSWEAAVERARREDRLVLAYVQHYPGFGVPDLLRGVVLADEDVCALIEERFVLVRVSHDVPTPLHDRPRYGLSSTTFGRALLVLTPEAQVLAETERLHPVHVDAFLRGVLAQHGSHATVSEGEPLARARALARRGDLDASLALLEPLEGAPAHLARARVLRRLRRPDDALQALRAARAAAEPGLEHALALEEGSLALRQAQGQRAAERLQQAAQAGFAGEVGPAAVYALAALALGGGDPPLAKRLWSLLVSKAPESAWAWRASARLAAPVMTHARLDWPAAEVLEACRATVYRPLPAEDRLRAARADALAFVLASQRPDGSWPSPWELGLGPDNAFTTAYAAICTRALAGAGGPEATAAAARGLRFLCRALRRPAPSGGHMDYRVWAHAYAARCLARCLDAGVGDAAELRALLREQVDALVGLQRPSGGWTYLLRAAGELSISFVTAAVLLALGDARDVGVEVPEPALARALDRLEAMRLADGGYAYLGGPAGNQPGPLPGAAGRAPLCALALQRWGRLDLAGLRAGLDTFVTHRAALWAERGKVLMHTGPEAQGSHYLLFDLSCAAEAVAQLPPEERAPWSAPLHELLEGLHTAGGAFVDTPLLGPCVGSGFALEVLAVQGR